MSGPRISSTLPKRIDRICAALMRAEIDLGFAFLRLAIAGGQDEASPGTAGLIERAILAHKTALRHLESMPAELGHERRELKQAAGSLLQAIVTAERQSHILQGYPRPVKDAHDGSGRVRGRSQQAGWRTPVLLRTTKQQAC